jgi:hypothetical protein
LTITVIETGVLLAGFVMFAVSTRGGLSFNNAG